MENIKRLFFGFEVHTPDLSFLPEGKKLAREFLHITLSFLGNISYTLIEKDLPLLPKLPFELGPVGMLDSLLFLPEKSPHVVAGHAQFLEKQESFLQYQKDLEEFLCTSKILSSSSPRPFLPHVTMARDPFSQEEWKEAFSPLPFYLSHLHLYESLGHSTYHPLFSVPLIAPFTEKEHTADIAFDIRGKNLAELYTHALTALAFYYPPLITYASIYPPLQSLEDVIIALNETARLVDIEKGCPFKAISFHGDLIEKTSYLEWEMIVDV